MKKIFLLTDPKKDPKRVLESIKHTIRKYIKREKRKELSEDSNFWKINCKFGATEESAIEIRFEDIMKNINSSSEQNLDSFYIELTSEAKTMKFKKKVKSKIIEDTDIIEDEIQEDEIVETNINEETK